MNTCSEAHNQLKRWNAIRSEWEDDKSAEIETEYINPMQTVLTHMNEKMYEINSFISETESKIEDIKEESIYG